MIKINIDKFICDFLNGVGDNYIFEEKKFIHYALKQQGLVYKNGKIVEIDQPPLTEDYVFGAISSEDEQDIDKLSCTSTKENNKPETIKFKTNDEEIYQDKSPLFQDSFDALKECINPDEECIELKDNTGEKVSIPKKKILEKINEIRNEEDDYIWPKDMIDQMHNEIAAGTPKVKAELRKYFANIFPYLYDVDVDKMVEKYKKEEPNVLLPLAFSKGNIEHLSIAYKNGIEDMLKLIKEGGENK